MSVVARPARRMGLLFAVLGLLLGLIGTAAPATAVSLSAPANLAPVSGSYANNPTLSWDRVTGASNYAVQVSNTTDFSTVLWSSTTINAAAVPTLALPAGALYWRVQAKAGTTLGPWSQGSFTRAALTVPSGLQPANGTSFPQPAEAARLSWDAVSGATGYTVQVANDAGMTSIVKTTTTKNLSTILGNLLNKTYYWRVRANVTSTLVSDWTPTRDFVFGRLAKPVLAAPALGASVDEPILSWQPVPGAATYEFQISTSAAFTTTLLTQKGLVATSFAPPTGFARGTYYWRVRPTDAANRVLAWTDVDTWSFTRGYAAAAGLQYPANGATVSEPVFYQWSPARLAESYTLQLSTSSGFSSIYASCATEHTTYVPTGPGDCWPAVGGTYYWRVIGSDGPAPLGGSGAQSSTGPQVRSFTYSPTRPVMTAPLSGSLSVPTLRWNAGYGAAQYRVTITGLSGQGTTTATTNATSYTPRAALALGGYRWQVQAVSRTGEVGPAYSSGEQPQFTVVAQANPIATIPNPTVGNQTVARFPALTWSRVTSATSYRVQVKTVAASTWTTLPDTYVYPAGDDAASTWPPGSYQWRVTAYNGVTALTTSATVGTFTISSLSSPSGLKVGMNGTAAGSVGTSCGRSLSSTCPDLRQTPVLAWNSDADAVYYRIFLATDAALTKPVTGYPMTVDTTRNVPTSALADNTGSGGYFWAVQACRTASDCTTVSSATNGFTKTSKPVQLLTPGDGDTVNENQITLTWRDYAETNQDVAAFPITDSTGVQSVGAGIEASQYRVQVAKDSGFSTLVNDEILNQTQFTASSTFYPQGTYFWRVRAIASGGASLPWSSTQSFTKKAPLVQLLSPRDGAQVSGSLTFSWAPQPGATKYDVEIYKNAASPTRLTYFPTSVPSLSLSTPIAVSDKPYVWRVRPTDAKGNVGRWSTLNAAAEFTVVGGAPSLVSPNANLMLPYDGALFTWTPVAGAAKYRWEWRNAGTTSIVQRLGTVATSYAPTGKLNTGSWEWRAVALDAAAQPLGGSAWRAFKTDSTGPRVKGYTPTSTAGLTANFKVTFDERLLNVTDQTFTITASGGSNPLAANVSLDATHKIATLNPSAPLVSGKKYVVRLTSGITDENGNATKAFSWTITAK